MSNQLQITGGAKVRSLEGVITGTSGVLSSVPLGGANGVATLDSSGKVPVSQLPASVVTYLGTWNAATNTPTLTNGTGDAGDMYICNVAGTVNFGAGPITFSVGDWVLYGSGTWQKSNGQNGTVTSVAVTETGDALTITGSPITTAGTINIGFAGTGSQYIKGDGTLATFPTTINEAKRLVTEVYNNSGATLTKGTVVYINGGQGNLPTITKAIATSDATSAQTYGVVQSDITNMNNGYVVVIGSLTDLDTQAYANGTQLYLSSTTAGAWTSVKQYAPAHLVYVGIVTRSHPTQGVVEIKIQNGYELDELHNVSAQTPSNGDILQYNSTTSLWTSVAGTTTNIAEGTNLYFTNDRARGVLSTNVGSALTYNSTTGRFTLNAADSGTSGYLTSTDYNYFAAKQASLGTGTTSQFLRGDLAWATPPTPALSDLVDVGIVSPTNGQVLTYRLGTWKNETPAASPVLSVFGRTGIITAASGDYNTDLVTEGSTNLYFTNARARGVLSTNVGSALTYNSTTGRFTLNAAATGVDGYLTATDYAYFSAKQASLGTGTTSQYLRGDLTWATIPAGSLAGLSDVSITTPSNGQLLRYQAGTWINFTPTYISLTALSATAPLSYNSGTGVFSISQANTSTNGYLSSTDWNTFNNKVSTSTLAGYLPLTGGTLTGALSGTSATFSSNVTAQSLTATNGNNGVLTLGSATYYGTITHDAVSTGANIYNVATASGGGHIFQVGGSNKLTIASTGAVTFSSSVTAGGTITIGNFDGQALKMQAGTATGSSYLRFYNSTGGAEGYIGLFNNAGTNYMIYDAGSRELNINSSNKFTFTGGGNVGIGTSSPGKTLDILGSNGSTTSQLKIRNTGNTSNAYLGVFSNSFYISAGGTYDSGWSLDGTNGIANIVMETTNGGSAIAFGTANGNTTATERMRITSGGQIFAGTTSAYDSLTRFSFNYSGNNSTYLDIVNNNTSDSVLRLIGGSGSYGQIINTVGALYISSATDMIFRTNPNVERMRITSGGNVGIGTSSPSQLLQTAANNVVPTPGTTPTGINLFNASTNGLWGMYFGNVGATGNGYIQQMRNDTATVYNLLLQPSGGNVLIGTSTDGGYRLYVSGSVGATGGFFEASDKRLKKELADNPIIENIAQIKPKKYLKDGKEELGYYAQDLQSILPSAVTEGKDGFLSLSYTQVHTAKIASLETEVAELKELIKTLIK